MKDLSGQRNFADTSGNISFDPIQIRLSAGHASNKLYACSSDQARRALRLATCARIDLVGAAEVFASANRWPPSRYHWTFAAELAKRYPKVNDEPG